MQLFDINRNTARLAIVASLTGALCLAAAPVSSYADTQSDLDSARAKLEAIGAQTQKINEELSTQTSDLETTESEIQEKQAKLDDSKSKLSGYVSSSYKNGGTNLLSAFTGTDSIPDMINRLFYMNKVADSETETINKVKKLQKQLNSKLTEQQTALDDTQKKVDELNAQQQAAAEVVNSLDAEVQAQLAQEAEQNEALQTAIDASTAEDTTVTEVVAGASQTAATNAASTSGSTASNSSNASNTNVSTQQSTASTQQSSNAQQNTQQNNQQNTQQSSSSNTQQSTTTNTATGSNPNGAAIVARAEGKIGCAYKWGAVGPDSFDCSGFVSYCVTGKYSRLGTTYTFLNYQRVSDPQPGDIVVNSNHTGIYIGGGMMIHAGTEKTGVCKAPVTNMSYTGSYIFVRYNG